MTLERSSFYQSLRSFQDRFPWSFCLLGSDALSFCEEEKKEIGPVNSGESKYSSSKIDSQEIRYLTNVNNYFFFSKHIKRTFLDLKPMAGVPGAFPI